MDKILQALSNREIIPVEQCHPLMEEYKEKREVQYQQYENFIKKLETLAKSLSQCFVEIMVRQLDIFSIELSEMFIDGFKLGVK